MKVCISSITPRGTRQRTGKQTITPPRAPLRRPHPHSPRSHQSPALALTLPPRARACAHSPTPPPRPEAAPASLQRCCRAVCFAAHASAQVLLQRCCRAVCGCAPPTHPPRGAMQRGATGAARASAPRRNAARRCNSSAPLHPSAPPASGRTMTLLPPARPRRRRSPRPHSPPPRFRWSLE